MEGLIEKIPIIIGLMVVLGIGSLVLSSTNDSVTSSIGGTAGFTGEGVAGAEDMNEVLSAISTQRVDFVGIGDSNQLNGGEGWDEGFPYALSQTYPMYATAYITAKENNGTGIGAGWTYDRTVSSTGQYRPAITPDDLELEVDGPDGNLFNYGAWDDTFGPVSITTPRGIHVDADSPIDVNGNLRYDFLYGTFLTSDGVGAIELGARRGESPWTGLGAGGVTVDPSTANAYGIEVLSYTLPAATRDFPIQFGVGGPGTSSVEGPNLFWLGRVINTDRDTGFAYTSMLAAGGNSARDLGLKITGASDEFYANYFGDMRRAQLETSGSPKVVIVINTGLNDRNDNALSIGTNPTDSSTKEGYKDNIQAIITHINGVWISNGWSTDELYYMLVASHPVSNPDDTELVDYREGSAELAEANNNVFSVNINTLADSDVFTANLWYDGGGNSHLTQAGYREASVEIFGVDIMQSVENTWNAVAERTNTTSQTSYTLLMAVVIVFAAVIILLVLRRLS